MTVAAERDSKRQVVSYLKRSGRATTRAIAGSLNVTDVAARQHLFDLERQGLVEQERAEPAGRGRPGVLWRLTSLANNLFPDRHDALTVDLIDSIRTALGPAALQQVIETRTERQLASLQKALPAAAPLRERLETLADQRTSEGYMAEVVPGEGGALLLVEHHCPICDAASSCQLFCQTELELFQTALGPDVAVERKQHLLSGDDRCVYQVSALNAAPRS